MKRCFSVLAIIAVALTTSSCASLTTGPTQMVAIDSNPQGADVTTDTGYKGVTPCNFKLERKHNHIVTIKKKGYKTAQIVLTKSLCGSTAGNIVVGGIIGVGVDAMTGAMFKLVPEKVYVELERGNEDEIVQVEEPKGKSPEKEKEKEEKAKGTEIAPKD